MTPISTFLDGRTPTQLRGAAFLGLSDTCWVTSSTTTDDHGGGGVQTWGTVGTTVARVAPLIGGEDATADRTSDRSTHQVYLPANYPIMSDQRLVIEGRGEFQILAVRDRTSEQIRACEVTPAG